MSPRADTLTPAPMTVEMFLEFCDGRPDHERWELIEGHPVMNASLVESHQVICANLIRLLMAAKLEKNAPWLPLLGVGTRVPASPDSIPQPNVFVKEAPATDLPITDDALVVFEVLSKSNTKTDGNWRKMDYASVLNCQHYVTIDGRSVHATRYDRATSWKGDEVKGPSSTLDIPMLGIKLPLKEIYRWTPLAR